MDAVVHTPTTNHTAAEKAVEQIEFGPYLLLSVLLSSDAGVWDISSRGRFMDVMLAAMVAQ